MTRVGNGEERREGNGDGRTRDRCGGRKEGCGEMGRDKKKQCDLGEDRKRAAATLGACVRSCRILWSRLCRILEERRIDFC